MRLEHALQLFLTQLDAERRSVHTRKQYQRHVRLLDHWLRAERRSRQIGRLDHEDLALFLASPTARKRHGGGEKKAASMSALRRSLRAFFTHAHAIGLTRDKPAGLVR